MFYYLKNPRHKGGNMREKVYCGITFTLLSDDGGKVSKSKMKQEPASDWLCFTLKPYKFNINTKENSYE